MAGPQPISVSTGATGTRQWLIRLFPVALFFLSFFPRLAAVNRYITPDELVWVYRSLQFREALLDGRWGDTLVAGHPGVTTTWLGALAMSVQTAISPDRRASYEWLARMAALTPDNVEGFRQLAGFLTGGRIAVALINSVAVVAIYFLAKRLWPSRAAIVAALFVAFDPFLIGLSGLFHVDGLSATFATLALLALAVGLAGRGRPLVWLAFSGAMAALAALSKSPLLLLMPITGLAFLWAILRMGASGWRERAAWLARAGLAWGAAFAIVALLFFPAIWAIPGAVMGVVGGSANRHLDEALRETFFLGRAVFDPGVLFYPAVLVWRLSPVIWLAVLPGGWLVWRRSPGAWRKSAWFAAALLVVWSGVFIAAITPAAKKFDRYILPVVPALLVVAGVAWAVWAMRSPRRGRWALPLVVAVQAIFWLIYAAYPLVAYNPLAGGGWTAARVLPAGWGEGISAAGTWLAENQPDAAGRTAISGIAPALAAFFPGRTLVDGLDDPATADYMIVTLGGRQLDPEGVVARTANLELLRTIGFGGQDQTWIYRQADPQAIAEPTPLAVPATFGGRLALTALNQSVSGETVRLDARWQRLALDQPGRRYTLRLAVADELGNVWAAQETDLLNEYAFYPYDWESEDSGTVHYTLELPPAMPPGTYEVQFSLVDQTSAGQLPVEAGGEAVGVIYPAGRVDVPRPEQIVSASRVQIPVANGTRWNDGALWLLGHNRLPEAALAGSDLVVEAFWHAPDVPLPDGLRLAWRLRSADTGGEQAIAVQPLSRFDTGQWRVGETVHEMYRLPVPPATPPGRYALLLQPQLPDGQPLGPAESIGEMMVDNIDREYTLPHDAAFPLETCFGPDVCLRGVSPGNVSARPGEVVELVLYWQAENESPAVYTAFIHVLNEAGDIVLQADHWPGGLPSDIWDKGQVIADRLSLALPGDLSPGEYRIRAGLYTADDGRRLPVSRGPGETDSIVLPLTLSVRQP